MHLKDSPSPRLAQTGDHQHITSESEGSPNEGAEGTKPSASCLLCAVTFPSVAEQRYHVRSDWHGYNLKQKQRCLPTVNEVQFEKLVEDLDESISGSESSSEEEDEKRKESTLSTLLKRQANLHHGSPEGEESVDKTPKRGAGKSPLLWFSISLLPSNISLGIYRVFFTEGEQDDGSRTVEALRHKQLPPVPSKSLPDGTNGVHLPGSITGPHIFLCMIGGGHFAAMIVSLAPRINKKHTGADERQATVIAHKTFHRYTTRRKQGGSQSANDSAKGAAHSAGASIRRYNEMALESEIRALLKEWKDLIDKSQLLFVRATGSSNRRIIFGPYDGQVLRHNDPRNRSFPFSTRRATQAELMRAFVELTRIKISEVDEKALATAAIAEAERAVSNIKPTSTPTKTTATTASKEEEAALSHTTQLQALIRRSKAPATLSYLKSNGLSADFLFQPESAQANHHAPTPLHLASSINSPVVVLSLLTKAAASPLKINGEGKPPFDLAGDRATRDAFRVARAELGEGRWDWDAAHCQPALSKEEADQRDRRARAADDKAEAERRKAETEHLKQEAANETENARLKKLSGKVLGAIEKTGAEKREEEARGMTPELRMRLERERRARAAEERMKRFANGTAGAGAGR